MDKISGLFLDDERNPINVFWFKYPENTKWDIVRSVEEFDSKLIESLEYNLPYNVISFDHDLGTIDETDLIAKNGFHAMMSLVDLLESYEVTKEKFPSICVHSQNPIGANNIIKYWNSYLNYIENVKSKFV